MSSLFELLAVAVGGAAGSMIRYFLALGSLKLPGGTTLAGTFIANLVGCLAIGLLTAIIVNHPNWLSPTAALGLRVGLLGGLTTFSTFAAEAVMLGSTGRTGLMAVYIAASVGFGLLAVSAGIWIASANEASS